MYYDSSPSIQDCMKTEIATINHVQYNLVVDNSVVVYLYDSNRIYSSTFNNPSIFCAIVANSFYYFSTASVNGIIKTSFTSPTIIKSYGSAGKYRGLYYDSANSRIIAAGCRLNAVETFDLNLNRINSVVVLNCPHGVVAYNSKIYVAILNTHNVVVISNGQIENTYSTVCSGNLNRISVDSFGYFSLACYGDGHAYLYDSKMIYTNKSIVFGNVNSASLDTNNRLAICGTNTKIEIYY